MNQQHHPFRRCDGITRRDVLTVGSLTGFGFGLCELFRLRAAAAESGTKKLPPAKARSCVLIWLDGGPSHLETFDPKPDAPKEVRGPFASIPTAVPGVAVCELLPRTAAMLDRMALIRSVTSPLGEHNFGTHYMLTGYKPTPVLEYPSFGGVVAHLRKGSDVLPPNVAVPNFRVGGGRLSGGGFLPPPARPFSVGGDPAKPDFRVQDLNFYPGLTSARIQRRREFVEALNNLSRTVDAGSTSKSVPGNSVPETASLRDTRPPHSSKPGVDPEFEQAFRLMTSAEAKQAFDLGAEPQDVRNRYGRRTIGQSCLLARRLIERGVPFVTVNFRGWDTHTDMYTRLKEGYTGARVPVGLIPTLDVALTTLVEDLRERRLLEETLIVVMGEFGRTPKLNTSAGRDHWPRVFSVLLAGGGVRGGQVVGESDAVGESPATRPVTPADLACTIYTLLGIDPTHELHTPDGRPVMVNQGGKAIAEVCA